jgi:DNA topoisomerase VI subunit B
LIDILSLQITKHHPSSVDLELVKRLIAETKASSLSAFLTREFDQVSKALAGAQVLQMHNVLTDLTKSARHWQVRKCYKCIMFST